MTESSPAGGGTFDQQIDKLADHIVQKATLENTPFDESVDAFKALTTYYALRLKHKPDGDEDEDGFSFASGLTPPAAGKSEEQPNGSALVRSRSRRAT